jgi:hypothetical protein
MVPKISLNGLEGIRDAKLRSHLSVFVQKNVARIRVPDREVKLSCIPEEQLSQTPSRPSIEPDPGLLSRLAGGLEIKPDTSLGKSLPCVFIGSDKDRKNHGLLSIRSWAQEKSPERLM